MPFNQFIREQLAGDLLPSENSKQRDELLIATDFAFFLAMRAPFAF